MPSIDSSIQWFRDRQGKVTYSMTSRNGPSSFDCSSAVYYALIQGGFFPGSMRIGNTDSLYGDLERNGWTQLQPNAQGNFDTQKGDIFLWGKRGASGGGAGHTGMFTDANNVIHCAYGYNGIHTDNYDQLRGWNGYPQQTFYRYAGSSTPTPPYTGDTDQNVDIGSWIKFDKTYRVDDVQLIGGIWQVRTNELCPVDFTWEDNGIPAEPIVEVDNEGYATPDQNVDPGSLYKLPGKFQVLDLSPYKGRWIAMIQWNGLKFWVDIETATEVLSSDPGTATPGARPIAQPEQPPVTPEPPVEPETPPVEPEQPEEPTIEPPTEPEIKPIEEKPMAFTKEQQQELAIQTQSALDSNEFSPVISDRVKTIAYFVTDIAAIVSGLLLTVLAIFHIVDAVVAITLNAALVAALVGFKQTFRLSSKKQ